MFFYCSTDAIRRCGRQNDHFDVCKHKSFDEARCKCIYNASNCVNAHSDYLASHYGDSLFFPHHVLYACSNDFRNTYVTHFFAPVFF